ncbi:MAG: glycosyltransferase family 4 protein [candidate division WOR-3 bacterium]
MLVNWKISYLNNDDATIQAPDKLVKGQKYWFFRYLPDDLQVDLIDFSKLPLIHFLEKNCFKFYTIQAIRALMVRKKYDLIISHSAQSAVFFAFLRSLIGEKMPPHLVIDPASFNGGRDNFFELLPIKVAACSIMALIYHATIQKQYYDRHLPTLSKMAYYIPFGVDTDFFAPMNLPVEDYVIAFGDKKRDYQTLIRAWLKLREPKAKLLIVGVRKLKSFNTSDALLPISFQPRVTVDKLKTMIAKSLFVVLPLPYYNYSYAQMSLLQSMSMGKAVIVTETPGIADYIKNGVNVITVKPYDPDDLAEKIKWCLVNRELTSEIGYQARFAVLNEYNEKLMAKKIYLVIKKLVEGYAIA